MFKVWPTNADQDHFRRVMLVRDLPQLCEANQAFCLGQPFGHAIADAYAFFLQEIRTWLSIDQQSWEERVGALYKTPREQLRFVVIDLTPQDDAQVIFETLNARGTPLLPSDLVKNFIFHKATAEDGQLERLYREYWAPFDDHATYWRKLLGRGHAKRARIDLFLQHFLVARSADDVPVAHLYKAFLEQARDMDASDAEGFLAELNRYAHIYRDLGNLPEGNATSHVHEASCEHGPHDGVSVSAGAFRPTR